MNNFFSELFRYNHHCNQQLATYMTENVSQISLNAIKLFSHILNAHHIWNTRIMGKPNRFGVWQVHDPKDFRQLDTENHFDSRLIYTEDTSDKTIQYKNTAGTVFSNTRNDMLFHIVNHSTYHRGQLATDFRQSGLVPLATDYIFYKR